MRDDLLPAFETFLVEDVILTLGNLRGSLGWLGQADPGADPGPYRAGLARLDRQIETLEDRARAFCRRIGARSGTGAAPPAPASHPPAITLERLLNDAMAPDGVSARTEPAQFRSSRAARG